MIRHDRHLPAWPVPLHSPKEDLYRLGIPVNAFPLWLTSGSVDTPNRPLVLWIPSRPVVFWESHWHARLNTFIDATSAIVKRQIELLGCALAALFVGLAAITLPFLGVPPLFAETRVDSETGPTTDWPKLDPAAAGLPPQLSVELYKQQVAEAATARANEQKPTSGPEPAAYFWFLLGTGAAITLAGALLPLKAQGKPDTAAS